MHKLEGYNAAGKKKRQQDAAGLRGIKVIREVSEIPKSTAEKRKNYRTMIRNDIQEAIEKGIDRFEFVGDYNFKCLAQYAREEARRVTDKMILEAWRPLKEQFAKENGIQYCGYPYSPRCQLDPETMHIRIISVKSENPKQPFRVFCEINPDAIGKIIERHMDELIEREQNRRKREREKG